MSFEVVPQSPLNFLSALQRTGQYGFFKILRSFQKMIPKDTAADVETIELPKQVLTDMDPAPIPNVQKAQEPKIRLKQMPKLMRKVNYKILSAFERIISKCRSSNTAFKQLEKIKKNKFDVPQTEDGLVLYPLWHFAANWVLSKTQKIVKRLWQVKPINI
jgi:hypothetical protein